VGDFSNYYWEYEEEFAGTINFTFQYKIEETIVQKMGDFVFRIDEKDSCA
jgi:hypothetical protein